MSYEHGRCSGVQRIDAENPKTELLVARPRAGGLVVTALIADAAGDSPW